MKLNELIHSLTDARDRWGAGDFDVAASDANGKPSLRWIFISIARPEEKLVAVGIDIPFVLREDLK